MDRMLLGTAATLTQKFYSDTTLMDPTGDVTATIYDTAGIQLDTATADRVTTGTYSHAPFVPIALDKCTIKWSGTFGSTSQYLWSEVEVVGARYFSLSKMRERSRALEDTDRYTDAMLAEARTWAEDRAEDVMQRSAVPRAVKEMFRLSSPTQVLRLKPPLRLIRSVKVDGTESSYNLGGSRAAPILTGLGTDADIAVVYEYGDDVAENAVSEAVMLLATVYVQSPNAAIPSRAERWQPDGASGMFQLAMASADRTGIPDVDAILQSKRLPVIA